MAVDDNPEPTDAAMTHAARALAQVQRKVDEARAVLVRLLQDVVVAESHLNVGRTAQMLEANEALVVAAVHAQTDADTAAQALDEATHSAGHDPLTDLPNRVLLLDRLAHAIAVAKRRGTRLALLFLDIDNFKQINDSYGHAVGDAVLSLVALRLAAAVRAADTVSRHGGDEFLILLSEVSQASDAMRIADKVIAALGAPTRVGELVLPLSVSIGISLYPDDGADADTLITRADTAMYRAKRHGNGSVALHGEAPIGTPGPPPPTPAQHAATHYEQALAEHERRHAELRDANEQLVLAALGAQELQAAAEQAQQRQAEFLAMVAHELSNPLAPIRLATAMLGRARSDEPLLPRVQAIIETQVTQMARLVGDLRDVSHFGSGTLRLERRRVDMAAVLDAEALAFQPVMDARRQRFKAQRPQTALDVHGDPVRLAQVVSNLLDNASKYTPDGGEVELAAVVTGEELVMTVSDSGIGITAQALPDIFQPFAQDIHAIGFNGVGVGIGLTVVHALVQAHGGTVVASSAGSGRGSQFVVRLPLAGGPEPSTAAP